MQLYVYADVLSRLSFLSFYCVLVFGFKQPHNTLTEAHFQAILRLLIDIVAPKID